MADEPETRDEAPAPELERVTEQFAHWLGIFVETINLVRLDCRHLPFRAGR